MATLSKLSYKRRMLILKWRRFLGLCVGCGAEAYGNSKCDRCQEMATDRHRKKRIELKARGLCRECGKNKVNAGGYRCDACLELMRLRRKPNQCHTDGCYNDVVSGRMFCQDCLELKEVAKHTCKVYFIECIYCKELFTSKRIGKKYCSGFCLREDSLTRPSKRICSVCGKEYYLKLGESFYSVCSIECRDVMLKKSRKKAKYKRRQKIRSRYVEHVSIRVLFKRDGGRCQICGKKLNMKNKVPHKLAPTRDHIIPASKGGETSYKNMQLACFSCNSYKSDRVIGGGDQLLLFGDPIFKHEEAYG